MAKIKLNTSKKPIKKEEEQKILLKRSDYKEEKEVFWEWLKRLGALIGLIGGALGLIVTYNNISNKIFVEPIIKSKLVSFGSSLGTFNSQSDFAEKKGIFQAAQFMLKIATNVTGKDLNYYEVIPYVKFDSKFVKGEIYYPKSSYIWNFDGEDYFLDIPKDKLIYYNTTLNTGETNVGYITFYVRDDNEEHYSKEGKILPKSVRLDFISSEDESKTYSTGELILNPKDELKYAFEEEIWIRKK
ncbi:MAG: hypothetical protein MI739_01745 [Bacteroidales bacterium]|nr:hypothetical protein [Bacteroidales bacterium]